MRKKTLALHQGVDFSLNRTDEGEAPGYGVVGPGVAGPVGIPPN